MAKIFFLNTKFRLKKMIICSLIKLKYVVDVNLDSAAIYTSSRCEKRFEFQLPEL